MAAISQCRALAGAKAFTGVRPSRRVQVANGSKYFMKKKDSYMVEVELADDEPEDVAVRKYMKLVMQSRVIEQLRSRKTKETKIEEYKRRFRERCEARKLGIVDPTWEELYADMEPKPFEEFFQRRDADDPEGAYDGYQFPPGADLFDMSGYGDNSNSWGSYMETTNGQGFPASGNYNSGGYM